MIFIMPPLGTLRPQQSISSGEGWLSLLTFHRNELVLDGAANSLFNEGSQNSGDVRTVRPGLCQSLDVSKGGDCERDRLSSGWCLALCHRGFISSPGTKMESNMTRIRLLTKDVMARRMVICQKERPPKWPESLN